MAPPYKGFKQRNTEFDLYNGAQNQVSYKL